MVFVTVHSLDILTHLHVTYGMLKDEDIQAIDTALKAPINGETHFKDFFAQIEDNQEAVATQNLYTTGKILSIDSTLVFKVGLYPFKYKEWRRKDAQTKHGPHSKYIFLRHSRKYTKNVPTLGHESMLKTWNFAELR